MIRRDRNGLEGIPLKLLLISILISLTMPAMFGSLSSFRSTSAEAMLQGQVSGLCIAAESCYNAGPGNVRSFDVEFPVGAGMLLIGGERTSAMSIGYQLADRTPVRTYLTDPCIRFITPEGGLVLEGPRHSVKLRCVVEEGASFVMVTL
ncbi:MAG TPA: hypothetical protein VLH13_04610 [Methanomassiliicoccales archaeon]|nr:hypothetical protein [Methanomassiliicoccales archaeon]